MVELSPFTLADAGVVAAWISGPAELANWAGPGFTWPLDDMQLAAYVAEPGRWTWTGVGADGRLVGHASLRLAADGMSARLGRVLVAPDARGQGYGSALLTLVLTFGFARLGLERVELGVFSHNDSAVRLYERLGFRLAKVLPATDQGNGQSSSALEMSLARADWFPETHRVEP
ncbi:GNAT family N-acetyltransferase [Streptomyces sp. NPDC059445]|uniref:GNAT family N-acetyltransferase n=1 Tax=Streptomyces sp. NPDC059445 TaxID=3346832 RepID=UPI0036B98967